MFVIKFSKRAYIVISWYDYDTQVGTVVVRTTVRTVPYVNVFFIPDTARHGTDCMVRYGAVQRRIWCESGETRAAAFTTD